MSAVTGSSTANPSSTTNAFAEFSSGEFLQIIFTELTNQDPLAPNETKDLIEQLSTLRSIESETQLVNGFDDLRKQNELTVSSALIGAFVTGLDEFNTPVASFVDSVSITRNGSILNLSDGSRVPIDQIDEVIDPALVTFAPGTSDPTVGQGQTGGAVDETGDDAGDDSSGADEDGIEDNSGTGG